MRSKTGQSLWIAALLAGTGISLHAAEFVPPAEGPVAFRRDKIPLDADTMAGLSRQLGSLAEGLTTETPAELRGAAQMLALALALDPANTKARGLIADYQAGRHQPAADAERLDKSRARIWQYITWLETPDAGSQGQALAACLKDIIVISDPNNPKSGELRSAGEKGAWAGWVPALSAYDKKASALTGEPKAPDPATDPTSKAGAFLEQAEVRTMIWQPVGKGETASWNLALAPLRMTATKTGDQGGDGQENHTKDQPFSVTVGSGGDGNSLGHIANSIRSLLKKQHDKLPNGLNITIDSKELEKSLESKKRQSISAAAAVLASSAITGLEPDAIIIGQVDDTGAFKLPSAFWDQLQALGKGDGRRLVLPTDAAPYLISLLALEKPGFFMEYEVLLASDFKQLLDLTAKTPAGSLGSAVTEFRKIRERAGLQDVRQYIANTFVKQRLVTVLQDAPFHVSAKLLLVQAAGNRPTLVARPVLAAEIRRALEPMAWILKIQDYEISSSDITKIGQTYELCRAKVEALERYADKNDRTLVDRAREVIIATRNLDRATRTRGEDYVVRQAMQNARTELNRLAKPFADELATEVDGAQPSPDR